MRRSRFSEEQVIAILKEQESGVATADVCRRHGISSATFSDQFSTWVNDLRERRGMNKAIVAVANKNARIIWALLNKGEEYRPAV